LKASALPHWVEEVAGVVMVVVVGVVVEVMVMMLLLLKTAMEIHQPQLHLQ
jgi:hypothetical protein